MPPWIMDVEFSDPPGGNGLYDEGETLYVTLVWSEAVTVSTPPGGLPPKVWTDSAGIAEYASGSGARRTVFRNTVKSNNYQFMRKVQLRLGHPEAEWIAAARGKDSRYASTAHLLHKRDLRLARRLP